MTDNEAERFVRLQKKLPDVVDYYLQILDSVAASHAR